MFTTLISTADLAARLGAPDLAIVDVRHDLAQPDAWGAAQYAAGHVPGARFAHLDRDLSGPKTGRNGRHPLPTPEACAPVFGRLGIDVGTQVVCYDQQPGMYASRLWWMLRWLGHDAVAVLDGGWARWIAEGRPVATAVPPPGTTTFTPQGSPVGTVAVDAVAASLPSRSLLLLDARTPERFRGEIEPLDPVAGHIPGAINRPYAQNLNPDGTFKPATALRTEYDALIGDHPLGSVVHQCGSGVTACHNQLAMVRAGLEGTRLYPGSWSEWVADPARPVATGS